MVTSLGKRDIILGYPWLRQHNPEINWQTQEVKLSCCPNHCAKAIGATHQERKTRPRSEGPQTLPQPTCYPDLDEDDLNNLEDDEETSEAEPNKAEGCTDKVEEGDHIFVMTYMLPETIGATSMISQQIVESVKDNPKQEKSLHNMVPLCFWGHIDIFVKKSFDSLPKHHPWDHTIELTGDYQSPHRKLYPLSPVKQAKLDKFLEENLASG